MMLNTRNLTWFFRLSGFLCLSLGACQNDDIPDGPQFAGPQDRGLVANALITEASGLAVSRSNTSLLWTHNDSGDPARLFLLTNTGEDRGIYTSRMPKIRIGKT
ncbi:MAG: hypothetical protein HC913_16665 [Microscillaceae bacterium]|nr:hypothetical protein [Microscillaceae bacterium]